MVDFDDIEKRICELEAYLDLIDALEKSLISNTPIIQDPNFHFKPIHQSILHSNVFLQLYNLIEATITRCLANLTSAIEHKNISPRHLSDKLLGEWVRKVAKTHQKLNPEKRLEAALSLCKELIEDSPITGWKLDKSTGNWDDKAIFDFSKRLGIRIELSKKTSKPIKQVYRDNQPALQYIKMARNNLAHGNISFRQFSENITTSELRKLAKSVISYLREVISCFTRFINDEAYHRQDVPEHA